MPGRKQALCRIALCVCPPLLAGCVDSPLSTLDPASDLTRSVATLWWWMGAGSGLVLLLMVGLTMLALRRDPPRSPGRRGVLALLIVGGLALPTVVIIALLAFSLSLGQAQWPPQTQAEASQAFHVDVIAHQWRWEARYPELPATDRDAPRVQGESAALSSVNVLHVPAGVPVHLRIMSADVIHSFWVPRISGKLDAVPGKVNRLRIQVDEPGEYAGVCAEYCGIGHAHMPFTLVAHPAEDMPGVLQALKESTP